MMFRMLKSTFYRAIISRRAVKQANIVWSVPRTPPQPVDDKLAGIEFHENDDEELALEHRFSKPLKGLVENVMSKDEDIKERLHELEQKSYFKPEIVPLFDLENEKGKIPKQGIPLYTRDGPARSQPLDIVNSHGTRWHLPTKML